MGSGGMLGQGMGDDCLILKILCNNTATTVLQPAPFCTHLDPRENALLRKVYRKRLPLLRLLPYSLIIHDHLSMAGNAMLSSVAAASA